VPRVTPCDHGCVQGTRRLTPAAQLVHQALVDSGELAESALGERLDLSPRAVQQALGELLAASLVEVDDGPGEAVVRIGITHTAAIHGLLDQPGDEVTRSLLKARQALDLVLGSGSARGMERLTDLPVVSSRLLEIVAGARRDVLNLHAGMVPPASQLDNSRDEDLELLARGVSVHTVCPQEFALHTHVRDYVEQMEAHGAITRFALDLPHRLVVVDGRVAILPIDVRDLSAGALIVTDRSLVVSLHHLGARILRRSKSLRETVASLDLPTKVERQVLMLMSAGLTDAASAKRLNVTERQYRRYVAKVMTRLNAASRFQAGVLAVERGWI
jgi:DNA-binding CsgD family transcriptional regulator